MDAKALTAEEIEECRANLARFIALNPGWPTPNSFHLLTTLDARDKTIGELRERLRIADEERAEVRRIVEARDGEPTPDAVHRALRYLFDAAHAEMKKMADVAAESIDENMRVGAEGMRDACITLIKAAGSGEPWHIARMADTLRKAIEALPLP